MGNRLAWTRTRRFIMKFKQVASKEEDSIEKKFDFNVVRPRGLLETARTYIRLDDFSDTNPRSFEQLCVTRYLLILKFKQNVFRNNDLNALNDRNSTVGRWSVGLGRPNSAPCQRIQHLKHSVLLCQGTRISCTKKIRLCTTYKIKYQRIIKHANLLQ